MFLCLFLATSYADKIWDLLVNLKEHVGDQESKFYLQELDEEQIST